MQPKKKIDECPWRKKSCFFTLPYWEYLSSRHHLDPMHIEKNITDSVIGTLLDMPGKTKDHYRARLDMKEMGIRSSLHHVESDNNKRRFLPKACFSMTKKEKTVFCEVLEKAKLPQGCASNIGRCVQMKELKISGYKSHDAHIIMQYLLQVAVRKTLPKDVALALIRLGAFFRAICSKVINPQDLDHWQSEIVEILCTFERIFPPSFFDILPHLPIHLVDEVRSSGPVSSWWMFFIERYLGKLKSYVRNRSRPEGSIAEGYLAEECLVFCSRYLNDGEKKQSRSISSSNRKVVSNVEKSPIFCQNGYPLGRRKKQRKGKYIV
ncbi:transposon protein [Striga asiatica]|uniref:Transposon protein n=1 Tax=Striga asiatica TaxID=4170 RepID=A0A5A7Q111_STRAF|nr:transposon protein [Striga asiatica]